MSRLWAIALAWSVALGVGVAQDGQSSKRMADGKEWTTRNLNVRIASSHCYDDAEANCRRYGRLYSWDAARTACQALGPGWRLPTNDEWRNLVTHYGALLEESEEKSKQAFRALFTGGSSGFNIVFGGSLFKGEYTRLEAHGFYWTATESDAANAWFYNFGKGLRAVNRHKDGEKQRALSVRCVKD
jgi:uncharacterized protein (TIGR02145 family)